MSYIYMEHPFLMFLDHTQRRPTVGRTPLDEWSACRRDLYLKTHNTHNRQTSMPPVGFEPTISAGERPQTYALDRAATGTGIKRHNYNYILCSLMAREIIFWTKRPHRLEHGCLSLKSVAAFHVKVSASAWSLVQKRPTECGAPECDHEASRMWGVGGREWEQAFLTG